VTGSLKGAKQRMPEEEVVVRSLHQALHHLPSRRQRRRARQRIDGKAPGGVWGARRCPPASCHTRLGKAAAASVAVSNKRGWWWRGGGSTSSAVVGRRWGSLTPAATLRPR
jgi:hypothetical protein